MNRSHSLSPGLQWSTWDVWEESQILLSVFWRPSIFLQSIPFSWVTAAFHAVTCFPSISCWLRAESVVLPVLGSPEPPSRTRTHWNSPPRVLVLEGGSGMDSTRLGNTIWTGLNIIPYQRGFSWHFWGIWARGRSQRHAISSKTIEKLKVLWNPLRPGNVMKYFFG